MQKSGILLINLGSPASPSTSDVRRYLDEFLMDRRVIDLPYLLRRLIVSAFILPRRPKISAAAYKRIWRKDGSPLITISESIRSKLQGRVPYPVALAMRYGRPSIEEGIRQLWDQGVRQIAVLPQYPHYAMATYETVEVKTREVAVILDKNIKLHFLPPFYQDDFYIEALTASAKNHLDWDFDHLLFSIHGIPERHITKSDPTGDHCLHRSDCCSSASPAHGTCYRHQVFVTVREFAKKLAIPAENYSVAFQSRLGRDKWLSPSTSSELVRLANSGVRKLAVICPAFTVDCLETLMEIEIEGRKEFLHAGGEEFRMIPCINEHEKYIDALEKWSCESLQIVENSLNLFSNPVG